MSDEEDEDDEKEGVCLHIGSSQLQIGYAGDDAPKTPTPSVVPRINESGGINLQYPIRRGIVTNWNVMGELMDNTLVKECPDFPGVIMIQPTLNPSSQREKMISFMFDRYSHCEKTYLTNQGTTGLLASGRTTGIVLSVGDGVTTAVATWEGYSTPAGKKRIEFGGTDVTHRLVNLINKNTDVENIGIKFESDVDYQIINKMKEQLSYIALEYEKEINKKDNAYDNKLMKQFELPDGKKISISKERFESTEILFDFSKININSSSDNNENGNENGFAGYDGIGHLIFDTIMKCPTDIRRDLFGNIILNGGVTMTENFRERLTKDMAKLTSNQPSLKVKIIAPPERKYSSWIGASILGSLSSFQEMWIERHEYEDAGQSIVHRKCNDF